MLTESHDEEQIIARIAALDIGKTERHRLCIQPKHALTQQNTNFTIKIELVRRRCL